MKKIVYLFFLLCFTLFSKAQDTAILCGDSVSITVSRIDCYNNSGFIDITYINTPAFAYSYAWYGTDTTGVTIFDTILGVMQNYSDTSCGAYTLIVSNNNVSCDTVSRFIGCPLTLGTGAEAIPCVGDSGTLKRPAFGGTKFDPDTSNVGDEYYLYTWFSADDTLGTNSVLLADDTTENLVGVPAGFYKVIVEDSLGCEDSTSFIEFKDPIPIIFQDILLDSIVCNGDIASLELQVKGGRKFSSDSLGYFYYIIQNNDTIEKLVKGQSSNFNILGSNILPLQADTVSINLYASTDSFQIVVADSMGCILETTIFISQPDPIVAVIIEPINTLVCSYDSALISLDTIIGGTSPYIFYWNNDITLADSSIYVNGGSNRIYIEDDYGCLDSTNAVDISSLQDFDLTASINNIDCYLDSTGEISLQITGGSYPLSYTWERDGISFVGGPSDIIKQDLVAGNYQLVIEDFNLCVDTSIFLLTENPEIILGDSVTSLSCSFSTDGNIQLNVGGGISPYTYFWSNNDTLDNIEGLQPGNYNVTVTDSLNCSVLDSFVVQVPDTLSLSFANYIDSLPCYGELTTVDVVINGGVGPFSVEWDNGDTTLQRTLGAGSYSCEVTDANGCFDIDSLIITEPDSLIIYPSTVNYSPCNSTGSNASVNYEGGVGPISILWSTDETTDSIHSLGVDSLITWYWVIVSDSCGNSVSDTFEVLPYYFTNEIIDLTTTTVLDDEDLWGASPYTYLWGNGENTQHADICPNDPPNSFWVEVIDNINCTVRQEFDIDPLLITLDPAETIIECSLENLDVELEAIVSGGTAPYTYKWSSGSTQNPLDITLNPGNYSVTVMDNNACAEDTVFIIATMSAECVPNVFSPNGDNINDTWSLEDTFLYDDSEVSVYGRYGKLLFNSIGYASPWDGKNKTGNDVPDGAYFYSIEIGHEWDAIKGSVTIIR